MAEEPANPLMPHLHSALIRLSNHPFPSIPSPDNLQKRASVALIIRVSPSYSSWPETSEASVPDLESFFSQDWVRQGQPEVLFIKRAARKGDRWTSHIALPGGKRDPEDADDLAAAIRETWEEVGLDVSSSNPHAIQSGNLPQRVITSHWGRKPLMVLCPYIFVLTGHGTPPLKLQPTEVASCHWVPLSNLLDARSRTVKKEDLSARFVNQETGIKTWMVRLMVGKMVFAAVRLRPSETITCTASPAEEEEKAPGLLARLSGRPEAQTDPPLLLWGLTLDVVSDLLDLLPPHNAFHLWSYPTFTPWDVDLAIWLMTYNFKKRKAIEVRQMQQRRSSIGAVELGLEAIPAPSEAKLREAGIHGLSGGLDATEDRARVKTNVQSAMLEGYYHLMRRAVSVALVTRSTLVLAVLAWMLARLRRSTAKA